MAFNVCRCPDNVPIGKKMVYASSNNDMKASLTGIKHVECHDEDEFSFSYLSEFLKSVDRA